MAKRRPRAKAKVTRKGIPDNFFSALDKKARILQTKASREFTKALAKEAKTAIKDQLFDLEPLSEKYAAYKKKNKLDPRILIATKDYVNKGIGKFEKNEGSKRYVFVGPLPGIHKPSGLTYEYLSRIHEYGTDYIPARPVWRYLRIIAVTMHKEFKKEYFESLMSFAKRAKRPVTKQAK